MFASQTQPKTAQNGNRRQSPAENCKNLANMGKNQPLNADFWFPAALW
jgi:hypothetical protein